MAAAPGAAGGRTLGRRLVRVAFWGLVALLLATAGTAFIASRTMTLQWAAQQATRFTDGRLQIEGINGSVLSEVAADALRWRDADVAITITSPRLTYHPLALLDGLIRVERIHAADVQVDLPPVPPGQPRPPLRLPQALTAMLPTAIERLDAGRVVVRRGPDEVLRLHNLEAVFRHDGDRFNASLLNADIVTGASRTAARGEVAVLSRAPYATDGRFAVRMPMQPEPLRVDLRINGPLEELSVRAASALAGAPVEARTVLRPLDPRPLRQVRVDVKDFDLSRFDPELPATRLTGSYEAEVMPAWAKESKPLLIGPLNVANAMPGPLDRKRLPVSAAKAVVALMGGRLELQGLQTTGPLGDVSGDGWVGKDSFRLALASDKLLLRGIDSTLAPRTLSARLAVEPLVAEAGSGGPHGAGPAGSGAEMTIEATASDAAVAAELRGVLSGGRLHVSRAHLQSKPAAGGASGGQATFFGTVGVAAPWPVDLSGEFQQFEPGQLVTMPHALLNGTWRLAGRWGGADGSRLEAAASLASSRLQGLPLAGTLAAVVTLGDRGPRRISAVDAALNWGSGTLEAAGALGDPSDALSLVLNLPKVDEVMAGMSGALEGHAVLRGGLEDPAVEATLDGKRLVATAGGVRTSIALATVQMKSAGVQSGLLNLQSRLDDVAVARLATGGYAMSAAAGGLLRFDQVNAAVDGSQEGHDLDLIATGRDQHVTLSASGGLAGDGLWRGVVNGFTASHPFLKMPGQAGVGADAAGDPDDPPVRARAGAPASGPIGASESAPGSMAGSIPGRVLTARLGSSGVAPDHLQSLQPFAVTAGAGRLSARGASFDFQGALLELKQADWRESVLTLSADASAVPARWVGRFMSPEAPDWRSFSTDAAPAAVDGNVPQDLRLAAAVDFSGNLADPGAAAWHGSLEVRRERGDVWLEGPGGAGTTRAGLRTLQASAVLDSRNLAVVVNVDGENIGRIGGEARTTLQGAGRPPWAQASLARSPLAGTVDLTTSSFRWILPLVGGGWHVDGALSARLHLAGTLRHPRADGFVTGNNLSAQEQGLGLRLKNGVLAAELAGDRIDVKLLRFESEEGSVAISGLLQPPVSGRSEAHVVIDRLPVPLGPGERVVLSGSTAATLDEGSLDITGRLVAEEGLIEMSADAAPEDAGFPAMRRSRVGGLVQPAGLPDPAGRNAIRRFGGSIGDEGVSAGGPRVLGGREGVSAGGVARNAAVGNAPAVGVRDSKVDAGAGNPAPARPPRDFGIDTDIRIDMGRHFRVSGSGLEGTLKGVIRLQSSFPGRPLASGAVDVVDGAYQVQGRKLKIRRGRLLFEGPLDNPVLDIVAVREHSRIEAGFAVGGTAMAPLATLISNPEVADADKLAWLVLGTGLRDAQGLNQMLALQAAAAALFGKDGSRYALGFAGKPALDLLPVREHDGSAGSSRAGSSDMSRGVAGSVGSRLSSRLSATCEQSLRSVWKILKLQYEITDRLSLSAQAGSGSAATLLGLHPFD